MNLFSKLEEGYDNLWKMVVRPPRCTYPTNELGPEAFMLEGVQVKRIDVELTNPRGLLLYASHFVPLGQQQYPCVVYLHRNSSNRTEG
jgi:cephalosporin-C deacetylase-like acetyl esterase